MDHAAFITLVERDAGLPRADAERAVRATLQTLAERISAGQARDIAAQLPAELRPWLQNDANPQAFDLQEFLRRVADRAGMAAPADAERQARAVFAALGRAISGDELADMASELPKDFQPLLAAAQQPREQPKPHAILPADEVLARVAERARLDRAGARRAADAVLDTLGERISGGEVDDLAAQLPDELREPLRRGDAASHGAARPLSLDEFVRGIAEREGVTPEQAREHARAVFATLREAVSEKELADISAQLPDDYAALMARP